METHELEERIEQLRPWIYKIEFEGGLATPPYKETLVNRQVQQYRYFFEPLLRVLGGDLTGQRVLDLGCNAGFWSLAAAEAGADFVLGLDGRREHIEQANFVFEAKGIDPARYQFEQANVFDYAFGERFDVVLCLGFMYHVSKPVELFELMTGVGAQVIVIETTVVPAPFSLFMMRRENLKSPGAAVDYAQVLVPTRKAVIELANQFGFDAVPLAPNITRPYADVEDYREQRRLAFICSKSVPLESLPRETSPPFVPWRVAPLLAREMRRRAKRRSKARQGAQVPA